MERNERSSPADVAHNNHRPLRTADGHSPNLETDVDRQEDALHTVEAYLGGRVYVDGRFEPSDGAIRAAAAARGGSAPSARQLGLGKTYCILAGLIVGGIYGFMLGAYVDVLSTISLTLFVVTGAVIGVILAYGHATAWDRYAYVRNHERLDDDAGLQRGQSHKTLLSIAVFVSAVVFLIDYSAAGYFIGELTGINLLDFSTEDESSNELITFAVALLSAVTLLLASIYFGIKNGERNWAEDKVLQHAHTVLKRELAAAVGLRKSLMKLRTAQANEATRSSLFRDNSSMRALFVAIMLTGSLFTQEAHAQMIVTAAKDCTDSADKLAARNDAFTLSQILTAQLPAIVDATRAHNGQFNLLRVSSTTTLLYQGEVRRGDRDDLRVAIQQLSECEPGGTDLIAMLETTYLVLDMKPGEHVVIFLSDGMHQVRQTTQQQFYEAIGSWAARVRNLRVRAVAFLGADTSIRLELEQNVRQAFAGTKTKVYVSGEADLAQGLQEVLSNIR